MKKAIILLLFAALAIGCIQSQNSQISKNPPNLKTENSSASFEVYIAPNIFVSIQNDSNGMISSITISRDIAIRNDGNFSTFDEIQKWNDRAVLEFNRTYQEFEKSYNGSKVFLNDILLECNWGKSSSYFSDSVYFDGTMSFDCGIDTNPLDSPHIDEITKCPAKVEIFNSSELIYRDNFNCTLTNSIQNTAAAVEDNHIYEFTVESTGNFRSATNWLVFISAKKVNCIWTAINSTNSDLSDFNVLYAWTYYDVCNITSERPMCPAEISIYGEYSQFNKSLC